MRDAFNVIDSIESKEDFISFIHLLVKDLECNSEKWENKSLASYLEAAASWTEDMEGYYINYQLPVPQNVDWKVFANILMAAKMYE